MLRCVPILEETVLHQTSVNVLPITMEIFVNIILNHPPFVLERQQIILQFAVGWDLALERTPVIVLQNLIMVRTVNTLPFIGSPNRLLESGQTFQIG
jgi:hypothetical protein